MVARGRKWFSGGLNCGGIGFFEVDFEGEEFQHVFQGYDSEKVVVTGDHEAGVVGGFHQGEGFHGVGVGGDGVRIGAWGCDFNYGVVVPLVLWDVFDVVERNGAL